jgi:hypothetical protein
VRDVVGGDLVVVDDQIAREVYGGLADGAGGREADLYRSDRCSSVVAAGEPFEAEWDRYRDRDLGVGDELATKYS